MAPFKSKDLRSVTFNVIQFADPDTPCHRHDFGVNSQSEMRLGFYRANHRISVSGEVYPWSEKDDEKFYTYPGIDNRGGGIGS